jgi:hypothetical protein
MPPQSPLLFFRHLDVMALVAGVALAVPAAQSQVQTASLTTDVAASVDHSADTGVSSSRTADVIVDAPNPATAVARRNAVQEGPADHSLLHLLGFEVHTGVNGFGVDVALPIARRWNIRVGTQYMTYSGNFTEEGANVNGSIKMGGGKAALDWFPFYNGFHISPQMYFGIQTGLKGNVIVPAGQTITLNGSDYVSSSSDPLTGSAQVSTRRFAPGLTVGWGNISPRGNKHLSFPVELGFYYIGQPKLDVTFKGSACDPAFSEDEGCSSVTTDPDFQHDLARFITRNNHNLSYASFFPIAQFGVGYRF